MSVHHLLLRHGSRRPTDSRHFGQGGLETPWQSVIDVPHSGPFHVTLRCPFLLDLSPSAGNSGGSHWAALRGSAWGSGIPEGRLVLRALR